MATATYIGVLSVSLDEQLVDPAALLLCVGKGLIVREELVEEEGLLSCDSMINSKTFCDGLSLCDGD